MVPKDNDATKPDHGISAEVNSDTAIAVKESHSTSETSSKPSKKADRKAKARKKAGLPQPMWKKRLRKLKPRWPGFKKLFGPFLIVTFFALLVGEGFIIQALKPDRMGKEIGLKQLYAAADQGLIREAIFLQEDSILQLTIAEPPPPPPPLAEGEQGEEASAAQQPQPGAIPAGGETPAEVVPPPAEPEKTYEAWLAEPKSGAMTSIIVEKLIPAGADVTWETQETKKALRIVMQFIIPLIILATVFAFFFLIITGQGGGAADFLGFSKFAARVQRKRKGVGLTTFKDVAAIDEGITELQEVVDYLMNPGQFAEFGARAPKGVLLAGPPGTGKTLLAKAVAGEAGVPFIQLSGSEFVESLVGVGAARVRSLFQQARDLAPCIIFIDELDAAGRQRGAGVGGGNDEREQTLNQLLVEMDGFSTSIGIAVLGATNRPDILDPALLRPGRFDRSVVIDVPDVRGREEILKVHVRGRPLAPDCNLSSIAKQTPGFTGADLANIINEAALLAVRRKRHQITQIDLEEAVDRVLAGPERKSHILTPEEKLMIAYHEAGHAVVARGAGQETGVLKLSIVARGLQLGHASTFSSADRLISLRAELEGQLITLVGGMAAEKLVFGDVTSGNSGDLEKATNRARKMVATLGMSPEIGPVQIIHEGQVFMGRDFASMQNTSNEILNTMDREIRRLLDEAEGKAMDICRANREILDEIVDLLLERETLMGPELEPILKRVKRLAIPQPIIALANARGNGGPEPRKHRARRPVDIAAPDETA